MVAISYTVTTRGLEEAVARFSGAADTTLRAAFKRAMRMLMRRFMGIIPPANQQSGRGRGGGLTLEDRRRGERALSLDLRNIFAVFDIRDAKLEAFLTRSAGGDASPLERALGIVAASEPAAVIHARVFRKNKKPGKALRNDRTEKYLIDSREFARLERTLRKNIGKMASGAQSGFDVLGIRSPAWVARHGSGRGRARYQQSFWRYYFEADATNIHPDVAPELERRLPYARTYTRNALERESEFLLRRNLASSGLARPGSRPRG